MRNMIRIETCILHSTVLSTMWNTLWKDVMLLMPPEHEITNQQISTIYDSVKTWEHIMAIKIMVKIVLLWCFLCSGHLLILSSVYLLFIHFYFNIFQTRQYTRISWRFMILLIIYDISMMMFCLQSAMIFIFIFYQSIFTYISG